MTDSDEVHILDQNLKVSKVFRGLRCRKCGKTYESPSPLLFSFNSPYGACPECRGFGNKLEFDLNLVIPNQDRTLEGDAIHPWSRPQFQYFKQWLLRTCKTYGVPTNVAYKRLSDADRELVLHGHGRFPGVIGFLDRLRAKGYKAYARFFARRYMSLKDCTLCKGSRLRPGRPQRQAGRPQHRGPLGPRHRQAPGLLREAQAERDRPGGRRRHPQGDRLAASPTCWTSGWTT